MGQADLIRGPCGRPPHGSAPSKYSRTGWLLAFLTAALNFAEYKNYIFLAPPPPFPCPPPPPFRSDNSTDRPAQFFSGHVRFSGGQEYTSTRRICRTSHHSRIPHHVRDGRTCTPSDFVVTSSPARCHLQPRTKFRRQLSIFWRPPRARSPTKPRARPGAATTTSWVVAPRHKRGLHRGAEEAPRTPCRVGACRSSRLGRRGRVLALSELAGARRALEFEGQRTGAPHRHQRRAQAPGPSMAVLSRLAATSAMALRGRQDRRPTGHLVLR
jgi:hypothetical protein